jgi:acrylyl-CoA reductase (NADPH)
MSAPKNFPALVVSKIATSEGDVASSKPKFDCSVKPIEVGDLDDGEVLIRVAYSALNYKDAMASRGHPGVARKFPLVPGIDAVGEVIASEDERVEVGNQVLIAHAKFGTAHDGGFAAFARVPADWVYSVPEALTLKEAVTWGTAGFTAAQSVEQIVKHEIAPESGDILVTGATGGVGIFAVALLSKLGYRVVASSGKKHKTEWLEQHGAAEVITRQETLDDSVTPLLKSRWAGAIDTVGGATLASVIRSAKPNACVTACGLVAGHELGITVYPFILRGVTLCGIDSANIARETRIQLWNKIANRWKLDLTGVTNEVTLEELPREIEKILAGNLFGRTIIKMT